MQTYYKEDCIKPLTVILVTNLQCCPAVEVNCIYLMMWHGRVRTELRMLSAAPLNLGSGFSRETPALESFLSHKESKAVSRKR